MKASELRIGNWVMGHSYKMALGFVPAKISMLGTKRVQLDRANGGNYENIKPIPLTEEILIKARFDKLPHFTVLDPFICDLGRGRHLSISGIGTPNEMAYLISQEMISVSDAICIHNYDYDGYLNLHQLQNLYFALTGQELTIEL